MRNFLKDKKRIVIKIGSQLLEKNNDIDKDFIENLAKQIKDLKKEDKDIILVSSGAVLAGIKKLNLKKRPSTITEKQAISAVGQAYLIQLYDKIFSKYNLTIAQILLTTEGLKERKRYNYARNTINKLLELNVIPIINENDTVAIEEIVFGDNDFLAAHVSILANAELLIILSTAGGVYTSDPSFENATLLKEIKDIEEALNFAKASKSKYGTGGMRSKLEASEIAVSHGIPVVIAPKKENIILDIINGKDIGTLIYPKDKKYKGKKSWLALLSEPKGKLIIDEGAEKALLNGKSLLPAGIKYVEGYFSKKNVVAIANLEGKIIGKGIINYSSNELQKILNKKEKKEAIHRDNLVIFED
ncbi:glutamate 5-kinase [Hydrogenothermus marinus]|uniref:Glutamate 5-kinase n=1 Tax=Hydrogenothermus marinus TaxID=133270 RepID=A0A3M0BF98_9AQUI|nr:glutamate 5-kinase [Hydrogenothermus marinus]RMA96093.1 glutamate 5-kinase [Hydrogenothermus marinus]